MNMKKILFGLLYILWGGVFTANADVTVYVTCASPYNYMYAWDSNDTGLTGSWHGTRLNDLSKTIINGVMYYYYTFTGYSSVSVIFNDGDSNQTSDITSITSDTYYYYDGSTGYTTINDPSSYTPSYIYYLVADGGAKCRFTPDRVREGGGLYYNYQNLHLQDFVISGLASSGSYSFHIEDASGNTYYPSSGYTSFSSLSNITSDKNFDASYSDSTKYYWISMEKASTGTDFSMPAGTGKSYTFLWEPNTTGIRLIVNGGSSAMPWDTTTQTAPARP